MAIELFQLVHKEVIKRLEKRLKLGVSEEFN